MSGRAPRPRGKPKESDWTPANLKKVLSEPSRFAPEPRKGLTGEAEALATCPTCGGTARHGWAECADHEPMTLARAVVDVQGWPSDELTEGANLILPIIASFLERHDAALREENGRLQERILHLSNMPCDDRNHEGLRAFIQGHRLVGRVETVALEGGPQEWMGQDVAMLASLVKERCEHLRSRLALAEACTDCEEYRAKVAGRLAAAEKMAKAWSRSWDCSRDPGHKIMEDAVAAWRSGETQG